MPVLFQIYCKHLFKGTNKEMLVSKIVVKIILKIYGENSPRGDLPVVIYVWYSSSLFTLKVFISLIGTSLMIATKKMLEKDTWRIKCNSREITIIQRSFYTFCYEDH